MELSLFMLPRNTWLQMGVINRTRHDQLMMVKQIFEQETINSVLIVQQYDPNSMLRLLNQ